MPRPITFSPNSQKLAYIVEKEFRRFVVLNNQESQEYPRIYDLTFSPDSQKFAYKARAYKVGKGVKEFVVINGKKSEAYDYISPPHFSPDSKYLGYGAKIGNELWWIVKKIE